MHIARAARQAASLIVRHLHISYLETKAQYQGTRVGVLWVPLQTLLFTGMLALVFRHSDTISIAEFFLYVLSGYVIWQFIQSTINNSIDIIQNKLEFAIHNDLGLFGLFAKFLSDRTLELGLNLAVLVVAIPLLAPAHPAYGLILALAALLLATSLAVSYLVNILTIISPDLSAIVRTGTRFVFFASPVFWMASDQTGVRALLATYNPISHYLAAGRQTFGLQPVSGTTWLVCLAISSALCAIAAIAFIKTRDIVRNLK